MGRRLSDSEALMWNLEQNPRLATTMGSISILERPPEPDRVRHTFARAVSNIPALRERVQTSAVPLLPHEWVIDRHLDLDHHVRFLRLTTPASHRALLELATRLVNDPFDRSRPLWQVHVITGLPRGRAAMVTKLHHSIADGQGAFELAANIFEFAEDSPPPDPVDLNDVLSGLGVDEPTPSSSLSDSLRHGAERLAGLLNDAASSLAHPGRTAEAGGDAVATVRALADQLPGPRTDASPMWRARSGNRRYLDYCVPLDKLKQRSGELGVSLNDLFVVACAEATLRQHERAGVELPTISATVVISTRNSDHDAATNAVLPVAVMLPGTGTVPEARLEAVRSQVLAKRQQLDENPDLLGALGTVANLIPSSFASALAADQAARVDFATSNLPGPPIPVWLAGRRIERMLPIGPVAGTAFNATLLSFEQESAIGLHVDPVAVPDHERLRDDVRLGLRRLGLTGLPK